MSESFLNRPTYSSKFRIPIQAIEHPKKKGKVIDWRIEKTITHTHTHVHTNKSSKVNQEQMATRHLKTSSPNGSRATAPLKRCPKEKIYIYISVYRGPESGNPAVEGGPCVVIHRFVRKFHIRAVRLPLFRGRDGQNFKRSELKIKLHRRKIYIYIYT